LNETSVLTRSTHRDILEDGILHKNGIDLKQVPGLEDELQDQTQVNNTTDCASCYESEEWLEKQADLALIFITFQRVYARPG
jgi:hypothetical protein